MKYKDLKELNDCKLSTYLAPGTRPWAAFNITSNDIFIHDNVNDEDIIVLFFDLFNYPIKKLEFDAKGWND